MVNPRDLFREDRVHRSVYNDPEIFELEMDRLFGRVWLPLGHDSQIPNAGDFFTCRMGRDSMIVCRAEDGTVRIFHNRCPHRGAVVCLEQSGSAHRFQCPYHGWAFSPSGKLTSIPAPQEYADPVALMAEYPLKPVARLRVYRGFIFASHAADGESLEDYLGAALSTIDNLVDRAPEGELEIVPGQLRHSYRGNWKLQFENLNDGVHPAFAHASSIAGSDLPEISNSRLDPEIHVMRANGKPLSFFQKSRMTVVPNGHSFLDGHIGEDSTVSESMARHAALLEESRGAEQARRALSLNRHLTLVYPSSTWHARFQTVKFIEPVAVDRTDTRTIVLRMPGLEEELARWSIAYATMANSPASPIITDDLDIYERTQESASPGAPDWILLSRGWRGATEDGAAASITDATSEIFIRNQYRAWRSYLEATP